MTERSQKRARAWKEMKKLELAGLGQAMEVSAGRDKFKLNVEHAQASQLSSKPGANGFIRADETGLLFRNASERLMRSMSVHIGSRPVNYDKGIEHNWGVVDEADIGRMFDAVAQIARQ
jgi:hypothetical protein